jgi:hypothetical protein
MKTNELPNDIIKHIAKVFLELEPDAAASIKQDDYSSINWASNIMDILKADFDFERRLAKEILK